MMLILACLLFLLGYCFPSNENLGVSRDIEESRERGVFVAEYIAEPRVQKFGAYKIEVQSAWLEHQWWPGRSMSATVPIDDACQLIVKLKEGDLEHYNVGWMIGVDADRYFTTHNGDGLIAPMQFCPDTSVERWIVQRGQSLSPYDAHDSIGEFVLYRK